MNTNELIMHRNQQLKDVVKQALNQDFANIKILDVRIRKDVDADGDDILLVDVLFAGKPKAMAQHVSSAFRDVKKDLEELGENAFPVMSFIAQSEMRAKKFAAA
jgi:hypothetical protein